MADAKAPPTLVSVKSTIGKLTRSRKREAGGGARRASERRDRTTALSLLLGRRRQRKKKKNAQQKWRDARKIASPFQNLQVLTQASNSLPITFLPISGDANADKGAIDGKKILDKGA